MENRNTNQALGIALAFTGGFVISFDVALIRLADANPWVMMLSRALIPMPIYLLFYRFGRRFHDTPASAIHDPVWVGVGILYGMTNIFFTLGVFYTTTANLVFILAFNPLLAALFSWFLIGERPKPVTWLAIAVTILGVAIIVSEGLAGGTWLGDLFALGCALSLAGAITLSRKSGQDMSLAPAFGALVSACFALPMALLNLEMPGSTFWLVANAAMLVPVAAFCLAMAPRYIPAPQVAIFYLLETVLAPVWVFLVFGEQVTRTTLIGGAIVLAGIAGHSLWQLRRPAGPDAMAGTPA